MVQLTQSGQLDRQFDRQDLESRARQLLTPIDDEAALNKALRRLRREHMVRVAWRDLSGSSNVKETMAAVSALAEVSIQWSLKHHTKWLKNRYGTPCDEQGTEVDMVVLGLGKLGGIELNYSSDIDLIFAFSAGGETRPLDDSQKSTSNQEFFIRLGRKLVSSLDTVTEDGFVFRTDMRLRPNGDSGPIALSFPAMEHYYQTHGRSWERYAFIKARCVGGPESLGRELLEMLRPFIYRRYLDFGAFDALREMKQLIERQMRQQELKENVKLGHGGIREIEFYVQSHQLIRGGRDKGLQTESIYTALDALSQRGLLDHQELLQLVNAYEFLRNCEHRLQMVNDRQTQRLPSDERERMRVAFSMAFKDWESFMAALESHRTIVHQLFSEIMKPEAPDNSESGSEQSGFDSIWQGALAPEETEQKLLELGFPSADTTPNLLVEFKAGRLYQAYSSVERDRLDRLMPKALSEAARHLQAERAIRAFVSVLESIGRRSAYLSLLIENPLALKQLLHLCAASPWLSRYIGQHPVILDELLQQTGATETQTPELMGREIHSRLAQVEEDDLEQQMNVMREFFHAQVLKIAAGDVNNSLTSQEVMTGLTNLAKTILEVVYQYAIQSVEKKQGKQPGEAGVVAYGKFASEELGYHSDLDMVVCYQGNAEKPDPAFDQYFYSRVGQRMVHLLTTRTQAGTLYELDLRLRPSGRSGTLVSSLKGFEDYQLNHAWTWEHQALVRAQVVLGSHDFKDHFEAIRKRVLCQPRNPEKLKAEILNMRDKMVEANSQSSKALFDMKLDYGGIVDIEFIVQYLVLQNASEFEELVVPRTTVEQLRACQKFGLLDDHQTDGMVTIYLDYLRKMLDLKLMDQPVLIPQEQYLDAREKVKLWWSQILC